MVIRLTSTKAEDTNVTGNSIEPGEFAASTEPTESR